MDHSLYIQEDFSEKVIADPPSCLDNLKVSSEGVVAVVSQHAVHFYQPRYAYMSMYYTAWVEIEDKRKTEQNLRMSYRSPVEWLQKAVSPDSTLCIRSHHFLPTILGRISPVPLSALLISDGTLLVVEIDPTSHQESYAVRCGASIRLYGVRVLLDLTSAFHSPPSSSASSLLPTHLCISPQAVGGSVLVFVSTQDHDQCSLHLVTLQA
ncbi:hypothetical protein EON63_18255, partial [archaeon]